MTLRVAGLLSLVLLTGCTITPPIVLDSPSQSKAKQELPPVVERSTTAPVPRPSESVPVVREPEVPVAPESPSPAPVPQDKPAPATPSSTLLGSVQAAVAAGELDRAAALCERALRISPRDAQVWYQLALIRERQNRRDDAAETARRALSLAGRDATLVAQVNALLQRLGSR